jgi:glucose/arabinose dehydrogenase
VRTASGATSTVTLTLFVDGANVGTASPPLTGWQDWHEVVVDGVALSSGSHTLRVEFTTGDADLDYIEVRKSGGNCFDGSQNDDETAVDCGGTCGGCDVGRRCTDDADCATDRCVSSVCVPAPSGSCQNPGASNSTSLNVVGRSDIGIRQLGTTLPDAVRIARHPLNGGLYVLTISGGIYQYNFSTGQYVQRTSPAELQSELSNFPSGFSFGIRTVQGFAFDASGNAYVSVNSGDAQNVAIIGRGTPDGNGWAFRRIARTDSYLNSETPFNHQFTGILLDQAAGDLYVASGSRTDHGEMHLGVRELPLTAAMFRIPMNPGGETILQNDFDLVAPYVFARGLRNSFDATWDSQGRIVSADNGPDADYHEELNIIEAGGHYGFPWRLGNEDNAMMFGCYEPSVDPRLHPNFFGYENGLYNEDPALLASRPNPNTFTDPVINVGPDADIYRVGSPGGGGAVDASGNPDFEMATFTGHRSPLGLAFDVDEALCDDFRGDAFILSWGGAHDIADMADAAGQDLLHLRLIEDGGAPKVLTTQLVTGFNRPIDSVLVGNVLYVIENNGAGRLFEITLPTP